VIAHPVVAGTLLRAPHRRGGGGVIVSSTTNTATTTNTTSSSSSRSSHPRRYQVHDSGNNGRRSNKQHPSHRKIRRWDNDNFIGTHPIAEGTHLQLHESGGGGCGSSSSNWKEYYMPNYPTLYRSSFAKLIHDTSDCGKVVRDRFLKGEIASAASSGGGGVMRSGGDGRNDTKCNAIITMKECVMYQMRKLGLSHHPSLLVTQQEVVAEKKKMMDVGRVMYQQLLTSRIRSVLSQSCGGTNTLDDDSSNTMNLARATVTAFERYLVSLALVGYTTTTIQDDDMIGVINSADDDNGHGYPPIQSKEVYEVFRKILSRPPKIVIKSTTIMPSTIITPPSSPSSCGDSQTMNVSTSTSSSMTACWIPTVHFYFSADTMNTVFDGSSDGERSSAFHRILLHSVCQFHGLFVSSSIIDSSSSSSSSRGRKKTNNTNTNKQQGGKGEGGKKNRCTEKVVTIQTGVMLAPTLRLLDYVV